MSESRSVVVADRLAAIPAFSMDENALVATMGNSIYPGAKPDSIRLVVNYCRANVLDPFQKPVHIVPMSRKTDRKGQDGKWIYEDIDTIMPGVGLYRIQAARTGEYGGISEPEFGPMVQRKLGAVDIEFPEWCKVTVRRIVGGRLVDFVAVEYWLENYASKSRYDLDPNAMWKKRPRGQLAKCAEAQALRKGFPEVGAAPTAEELEGKWVDSEGDAAPPPAPAAKAQPRAKSEVAQGQVMDVDPTTGEVTPPAATPKDAPADEPVSPPAPAGMLKLIRAKATGIGVDEATLCTKHQLTALDTITIAQGNAILKSIAAGAEAYAA
jgi:phage recombination protein Bet